MTGQQSLLYPTSMGVAISHYIAEAVLWTTKTSGCGAVHLALICCVVWANHVATLGSISLTVNKDAEAL